jgi:hypothetical protein
MVSKNSIVIENINITYISTKTHGCGTALCYFKVTGFNNKKMLCPILSELCDECRIPVWLTDSGEYMIKVKHKNAPELLVPYTDLKVMLTFKYYCMETDDMLIQGYYALVTEMKECCDEDKNDN